MKVRIPLPDNVPRKLRDIATFADDIILWAMELDQDIDVYSVTLECDDGSLRGIAKDDLYNHSSTVNYGYYRAFEKNRVWLVFKIDPDFMMFFMLRWGASKHKYNAKDAELI